MSARVVPALVGWAVYNLGSSEHSESSRVAWMHSTELKNSTLCNPWWFSKQANSALRIQLRKSGSAHSIPSFYMVSTTRRHPGLIYIWAGAPPLWAGPKCPDPMRRRAGSVWKIWDASSFWADPWLLSTYCWRLALGLSQWLFPPKISAVCQSFLIYVWFGILQIIPDRL